LPRAIEKRHLADSEHSRRLIVNSCNWEATCAHQSVQIGVPFLVMGAERGDAADALTVRDAAARSAMTPRSIRRKLSEGAFPHAVAVSGERAASEGRWRIPVADLERAGFTPKPAGAVETRPAQQHAPAMRTAELRIELARAVADAEIAMHRQDAERWKAIAAERERALERADAALSALADALAVTSRRVVHEQAPAIARPAAPARVEVPAEVREAALREMTGHDVTPRGAFPRRWWQR
jgi:hypothetical protein